MMLPHHHRQAGFTLIEILVVAVLFTIIMFSVAGLFSQALLVQRRALAIRRVAENAQVIIETVGREVRVSRIVSPNNSCSPADPLSQSLTIDHPVNGSVSYSFDSIRGAITRKQAGFAAQDITTADVTISSFLFCVRGSGPDEHQARVTMPMTIVAKGTGTTIPTAFSLQTTVSSRDTTEEPLP